MIVEGRVVIVTGASRGIGRAHALAFASEGASVVVNDVDLDPASTVVKEIEEAGGKAVANTDDVADWAGSENLITTALDSFGRLDVLVNNAGFLRDRMLVNLSEDEWDAVVRVHLKGHFAPMRHAAAHWRSEAKAGRQPDARVINTSSGAGLFGSVGQGNYAAAKAGIAGLTVNAAAEFGRYGVTVNAIAPASRTRMTEVAFAENMAKAETDFDAMAPENVLTLVVWLGSAGSVAVTGRVFEVDGGRVSLADPWRHGVVDDKGARWEPSELGPVVERLVAGAPASEPVYGA